MGESKEIFSMKDHCFTFEKAYQAENFFNPVESAGVLEKLSSEASVIRNNQDVKKIMTRMKLASKILEIELKKG